ncbi:MAG: hypothetical protein KAW12_23925 [Candidatus Aminicenantes bacterium]|nr:hypothetical protein [Candidatus Aminicenantes bacterium]
MSTAESKIAPLLVPAVNIEKVEPVLGFFSPRPGFTKETEVLCREKGFAYSCDEQWLDV